MRAPSTWPKMPKYNNVEMAGGARVTSQYRAMTSRSRLTSVLRATHHTRHALLSETKRRGHFRGRALDRDNARGLLLRADDVEQLDVEHESGLRRNGRRRTVG